MLDIKCGELGQDTPDIEEHHANLKENTRTVAEIICMQKVRDMHWKPPCTTHTVEVLFIGLNLLYRGPRWSRGYKEHFPVTKTIPYQRLISGACGIPLVNSSR